MSGGSLSPGCLFPFSHHVRNVIVRQPSCCLHPTPWERSGLSCRCPCIDEVLVVGIVTHYVSLSFACGGNFTFIKADVGWHFGRLQWQVHGG